MLSLLGCILFADQLRVKDLRVGFLIGSASCVCVLVLGWCCLLGSLLLYFPGSVAAAVS